MRLNPTLRESWFPGDAMKIYWNRLKLRGSEEWITYEYKDSWNIRYFSFDGQKTWHRTKREALQAAGLLPREAPFTTAFGERGGHCPI